MIALAALLALAAASTEPDTREYRVTIEGKPAGQSRQTVTTKSDGSIEMTCQAEISIRVWFKTYVYGYRGTETWKDGKLVKLESSTVDDDKRFNVTATAESGRTRIVANRSTRTAAPNLWTTTYWQVPPLGEINRIDCDTGIILPGKVEQIRQEQLTIAGKPMNTRKYRISGASTADLWYDDTGRLVRQETWEEGRRVVLELTR